MKPKAVLIYIAMLAALFLVIFLPNTDKNTVTIRGTVFEVEIADTDSERTLGLSGHAPLGEKEGMLFVFDEPGIHSFWMKDMLFPIDIMWIDEDKRIIHIEKSVLPSTYPQIFSPSTPALYVLEIDAGEAEKLQIGIGDIVDFALN